METTRNQRKNLKRKQTKKLFSQESLDRIKEAWRKIPKQYYAKVGDRVEITNYIALLKHRKKQIGYVISRDGGYVYVRPTWCKWEVECYDCELKKVN